MKGYIQWYLDHNEMKEATEPFLRYKKAKTEALNRASFNMYSKIIKEKFNTNEEVARYLRFARTLVNNEYFAQAFNKVVDNLSFPEKTNREMYFSWIQKELVDNNLKYQALTHEIQNSIQSIINVLGTTGLDAIIPGSDAYNELVKFYNGDVGQVDRIITQKHKVDLEKTFAGQYRSMIGKIPSFMDILEKPGDDISKTFELLARMLLPIQTLTGICSEYQAEYELNKLLEEMQKSLKLNGVNITRVGDESDPGFRIGTADLSIQMGENPHISFNMPNLGITLKRSHKNLGALKDDGTVTIQLKSGTTYGALMQDIDPDLVTAFYTIYANTRPIIRGQQQAPLPTSALTNAYAQMKQRMFVTALIGSAKSENLVFVMVINNKAFTIFDLLQRLKEETYANESTVLLKPAFRTMRGGVKLKEGKKATKKQVEMGKGVLGAHQEYYNKYTHDEKEKRSEDIRNYIDEITASMEMVITKKLLNAV